MTVADEINSKTGTVKAITMTEMIDSLHSSDVTIAQASSSSVSVKSHCGSYFDSYIEEHNFGGSCLIRSDNDYKINKRSLWKGRKFRLLLSEDSPTWHIGKVKQLVCRPMKYQQNNDGVLLVDWFLTMEFETVPQTTVDDNDDDDDEDDSDNEIALFHPGDYVELKELVAASEYNGQYGIIVSDNEFYRTDRYTVQVRSSVNKHKTKLLTIRPKNLTRFITLEDYSDDASNTIVDTINISSKSVASTKSEWTWKFHRVQPNTGGTLEGTAEDCTSLISFEWLDASQPLNDTSKLDQLETMEFRSKYEMIYECIQQLGNSGYYLNTSGYQRSRLANGVLKRFYFVRVDGNNKIENTSQQFKLCPIESLPRDDTMPSPPRNMWPRDDLDDEGTEENWVISTFNRVAVEGSFVVEWSDNIINSDNGEKGLQYSFYVDSLGPKEPPLRKSYAMVSFVYSQQTEVVINNLENSPFMGNDVSSRRGGSFGILNDGEGHPFMKFFNENQSNYFCARLWHWALRQRNVISLMKQTGTQMALRALLVLYINNKSRKDALNVAIMKVEYEYQIKGDFADGNERIYHASLKVGSLLEALGRFSDAGQFYAEIGDTFLYISFEPYFLAGKAFKQTGNFIEAERHFVKVLHYNRIANNPNDKQQAFLFEELVQIYYFTNREGGDQVSIGALLPTLLCVAGFDSYLPFIETIGAYNGILRKKFDSRSASRNVLEKAMQFSTVEDFRDVLLACKNPKAVLRRVAKDHSVNDSYFAECRKRDKKIAKQALGARSVVVPADQTCDNCSTLMLSPKQCPCETVLYCSKSCQLSHWKSHKQVCPFRAKKTDN